jgi:hypothetical protein
MGWMLLLTVRFRWRAKFVLALIIARANVASHSFNSQNTVSYRAVFAGMKSIHKMGKSLQSLPGVHTSSTNDSLHPK